MIANPEPAGQSSRYSGDARNGRLRALLCAAAYLLFGALTLSPLVWASVPALADYPNHLARMWILFQNGSIPALANNYVPDWHLLPNLAMDLVVPALAHVMPFELAGRAFVALTMLLLVGGTATLYRVLHGHLGLWPITSFLFIYNVALFWGLLNFLFGAGLAMFALSGWFATRNWRIASRAITFSIVSCILLILHLFAFALYAFCVVMYEIGASSWRKSPAGSIAWLCRISLQFIPALLLWLATLPNLFWFAALPNVASGLTQFGSFADKAYAFQAPFAFGQAQVVLDKALILVTGGFLIFARNGRLLKLAPEMKLPIYAMLVAAVLTPSWLGGTWLVDARLPVILPFMFIASTELQFGRPKRTALFALAALAILGARIWAVSESWRDYDRLFAEFRSAASVITPGARLLVVDPSLPEEFDKIPGIPTALSKRQDAVFWHMPALAVIDRSAFIPFLFTSWAPVRPTERNAGLFWAQGAAITPDLLIESEKPDAKARLDSTVNIFGEKPYWSDWPNKFDFVLSIDFTRADPHIDRLQPVAAGSFFRIYRVTKP